MTPENESGRTLTEMLGVLAIMGVLTIGGVAGFNYAMDKHACNQVLDAATKRAVLYTINPHQTTLGDFPAEEQLSDGRILNTVVTSDEALYTGQFGIEVLGVSSSVCQKLGDMVGDKTVLRKVDPDTCDQDENDILLVYDVNMDITHYAEENATKEACTASGFYWCVEGNFANTCRRNCCEGSEESCKTCDPATGSLTNKANLTACPATTGRRAYCDNGECIANGCFTNADCNPNQFCNIKVFKETGGTTDPLVKGSMAGTCKDIPAEPTPRYLNGIPSYDYGRIGSWWSVNNLCEAVGKRLFSAEDYDCYPDGKTKKTQGRCCSQGNACTANDWTACKSGDETACAKYSKFMVDLWQQYGYRTWPITSTEGTYVHSWSDTCTSSKVYHDQRYGVLYGDAYYGYHSPSQSPPNWSALCRP